MTVGLLAWGDAERENARGGNALIPDAFDSKVEAHAAVLKRYGYSPAIHEVRTPGALRQALNRLYRQGAQGIIIVYVLQEDFPLQERWERFSVVTAAQRIHRLPFHEVTNDFMAQTLTLFRRMVERGYRRIGPAIMSHGDVALSDDQERFAGVLAAQDEASGLVEAIPPLRALHREEAAYIAWVKRWRPDGVMGFSPKQGHLLEAAMSAEEARRTGYGSLHVLRPTNLAFTGLWEDREGKAEAAVQMIDQLIRNGERGIPEAARSVRMRHRWHEGLTLPQRTDPPTPRPLGAELHAAAEAMGVPD
jgi:LacI family transcriptional regulator